MVDLISYTPLLSPLAAVPRVPSSLPDPYYNRFGPQSFPAQSPVDSDP